MGLFPFLLLRYQDFLTFLIAVISNGDFDARLRCAAFITYHDCLRMQVRPINRAFFRPVKIGSFLLDTLYRPIDPAAHKTRIFPVFHCVLRDRHFVGCLPPTSSHKCMFFCSKKGTKDNFFFVNQEKFLRHSFKV